MWSDLDTSEYTLSAQSAKGPSSWSHLWSNNVQVCWWVSVIGSLKESQWFKASATFSNGTAQDKSVSFFDDQKWHVNI